MGVDVMLKFAEMLTDCSVIEKKPEVMGRNIFMYLAPISKK